MKKITYLLLPLLMVGCFSREPVMTSRKGTPIPKFHLFLADSSTYFSTESLPIGKPIVFFYFGPNCPYSQAQMEDIIDNFDKLEDIQFVIFTTSPFHEMKWFYKSYKLEEYSNIITGVDYTNFFIKYFEAKGVPYIAIYGKDRKLKDAFEGLMPVRQLKSIAMN